VKDKDIYIVF